MQIVPAATPLQVSVVRELFEEYASGLGIDLSFQGFEDELGRLPGEYTPPRGSLLLAMAGSQAAGCVAMRPLDAEICEMKRLYVRAGYRGLALGRRLTTAIMDDARRRGYSHMRLDTLPEHMGHAIVIYRSAGFEPIDPYYSTPIRDTLFLEAAL